MVKRIESGMTFGDYAEDSFLDFEGAAAVKRLGDGVKVVEFAFIKLHKGVRKAYFIEAKSSAPNPKNGGAFGEFVDAVCQKFRNAVSICAAFRAGRHGEAAEVLPAGFMELEYASTPLVCVLVIRNHDDAWCSEVSDALTSRLSAERRIWPIRSPVVVLNEGMARRQGLLVTE